MPGVIAPNPNQPVAESPTNKWTLMFYIAGDESLSASMISQLKELTDAGYQEDTTVLVYFDPNCNGRNARVFEVNHFRKQRGLEDGEPTDIGDGIDPYVRNIAEDCHIQGLPQIPAAVTLRYFLQYSRSYHPAENYMLFLMGHGVIVGNDSFLPDADDGSAITLSDLGKILTGFGEKIRSGGDEFHLVGFHSCSMNSIEVAYELQGSARYMIGTQGSAFPGSWPYRQLLKKIFCAIARHKGETAESTSYPNELVQEILTGLQNLSFYNSEDFWHAGFSADLSMCSLDKDNIGKINQPLSELAAALKSGLQKGAREGILLAHWESQSYWAEHYTDLYDLCDRLQQYCAEETESQIAIRDACAKVKTELETYKPKSKHDVAPCFSRLVVFSDYYGPSYQFSHGLSIYFPWMAPTEGVIEAYGKYAFTTQSGSDSWLDFLKEYFDGTRRPLRDEHPKQIPRPKKVSVKDPNKAWEDLSDEELLSLGPPPPGKPTGTLGGVPDKPSATLGGPPDKPTATLGGPPDKPTATLGGPPDKPTATLGGPPDKPTATLGGPPDKPTATLGGPPDKPTATLGGPPDKPTATLGGVPGKTTATLGPPPKPTGTMGLFGLTVIKNFSAPEDVFISSRRARSREDRGSREDGPSDRTE